MKLSLYKLIRHFALSVIALIVGLSVTGTSLADTSNNLKSSVTDVTSKCQPYSIPLSPVPCDAGYTGKKFPMRTKTCPDGKITDGLTFDYSNCKPAGRETVDINATDCSITPTVVGCMAVPTLSGCPSGKHWTLAGTNIAHCVNNDPVCPWGTSLKHDAMGEPSCVANTCPSNQVLQGDGISCACPPSLSLWNGSSCVAPCNNYSAIVAASCPSGQTGSRMLQNTYDCNSNLVSSYETSNTCASAPVSCPGPSVSTGACDLSRAGTTYITTTYTPINGMCSPSYSYDRSGCYVPSTGTPTTSCPSPTVSYGACPSGQNGQTVITTSYYGSNGSCNYTNSTDSSGCYTPATSGGSSTTAPAVLACSAPKTTYDLCPSGQTGIIKTTTSYVGASCTASTVSDSSGCTLSCNTTTSTETAACDAGYSGQKSRTVTNNTCTGVIYGDWYKSDCVPDTPAVASCAPPRSIQVFESGPICVRPIIFKNAFGNPFTFYASSRYSAIFPFWEYQSQLLSSDFVRIDQSIPAWNSNPILILSWGSACASEVISMSSGQIFQEFTAPEDGYLAWTHSGGC